MLLTKFIHAIFRCAGLSLRFQVARVNTTSRQGIKQLGDSFGSIFLLFSFESSWGPCSKQVGKIPSPCLLMTALGVKSSSSEIICKVPFNLHGLHGRRNFHSRKTIT